MSELDFTKSTLSNMTDNVEDYTIDSLELDTATSQDETKWTNSEWSQQWGYFNDIAELKAALLMKAIWNVGKSFTADPETTVILDHISGWGKDTFDDILFNMEVIKRVSGDSYAEIVRDEKTGLLLNLKPLDPSTISIVVNSQGKLKRYEQSINGVVTKFKTTDIFHLSNNRLASQIHGISDIKALEKNILADAESFNDGKTIHHRSAKPLIMFKLGTDNQAKIDAFVAKMDSALNKGENIYIPDDKNSVNYEVVQVDVANSFLAWRTDIRNSFYRALGLPQVIFGQGQATESGGKMEVFAHSQVWAKDQLYLEKQIWNQLNLRIKLVPPQTLLDGLQQDEQSDNNQQLGLMPSNMTPGQAG